MTIYDAYVTVTVKVAHIRAEDPDHAEAVAEQIVLERLSGLGFADIEPPSTSINFRMAKA